MIHREDFKYEVDSQGGLADQDDWLWLCSRGGRSSDQVPFFLYFLIKDFPSRIYCGSETYTSPEVLSGKRFARVPQEVPPLYILNFHFSFKRKIVSLHISAFSKNTTHALAHFESFLRLPTVPTKKIIISRYGVLGCCCGWWCLEKILSRMLSLRRNAILPFPMERPPSQRFWINHKNVIRSLELDFHKKFSSTISEENATNIRLA